MFLTDKRRIMSVPPECKVACNPISICVSLSVNRIPQKCALEKLSQNFVFGWHATHLKVGFVNLWRRDGHCGVMCSVLTGYYICFICFIVSAGPSEIL